MKTPYLFTLIAGFLIFSTVDASEPRLDHVVVAVRNIEATKQFFNQSGFTIKNGKVHDNGLSNAFIEFEDASEIEFMSVIGVPAKVLSSHTVATLTSRNSQHMGYGLNLPIKFRP